MLPEPKNNPMLFLQVVFTFLIKVNYLKAANVHSTTLLYIFLQGILKNFSQRIFVNIDLFTLQNVANIYLNGHDIKSSINT